MHETPTPSEPGTVSDEPFGSPQWMGDLHREQFTWPGWGRVIWWTLLAPAAAVFWAATKRDKKIRYGVWIAVVLFIVVIDLSGRASPDPDSSDTAAAETNDAVADVTTETADSTETADTTDASDAETADADNNDTTPNDGIDSTDTAPDTDSDSDSGVDDGSTTTTGPVQSLAIVTLAANCDNGATGSVHNTGQTTLWVHMAINGAPTSTVDTVLEPGQHADFDVPQGVALKPGDVIELTAVDDDTYETSKQVAPADCPDPSAPDSAASPAATTAASLLATLTVENEPARVGYDRHLFDHWSDLDGDGCNTRYEVLVSESREQVATSDGCRPVSGVWVSAFDGKTTTDPSTFDIDHLVPLAEAWDSGADSWSASRREAFANDETSPLSLIAVSASSNRSKSDRDPAEWLPPSTSYHCTYVASWVSVKAAWGLSVDPAEKAAIETVLADCGDIPADPTSAPTTTAPPTTAPPTTTAPTATAPATTAAPTTTAAPVTTTTPPATTTAPTLENPGDAVNCGDFSTQADAQAWHDLYFPQFGDVANLDGDGDGVVCVSLP